VTGLLGEMFAQISTGLIISYYILHLFPMCWTV